MLLQSLRERRQAAQYRHRQRHRDRLLERQRVYRQTIHDFIIVCKSRPCADCANSYPPYVMDFDHVRGVKLFDISTGARCLKAVATEAEKCDVVCANCHRERTHQRQVA